MPSLCILLALRGPGLGLRRSRSAGVEVLSALHPRRAAHARGLAWAAAAPSCRCPQSRQQSTAASRAAGRREIRGAIFTPHNVLLQLDRTVIRKVEGEQNVLRGATARALLSDDPQSAIARWRRGDVHAEDPTFEKRFRADMRRLGPVYTEFNVKKIIAAHLACWCHDMPYAVIDALVCMKAEGMRLAVISDTGFINAAEETRLPQPLSLFDVVIEPCRLGKQKGDADIYQIAIDQLQLTPDECVYFDPYMKHNAVAESLGILALPVVRLNFAAVLEPVVGYQIQGFVPGTVAVRASDKVTADMLVTAMQHYLQLPSFSQAVFRRFVDDEAMTTFHVRSGQAAFLLRLETDSRSSASSSSELSSPVATVVTAEQEYRLAEALHGNGVPIPKLLWFSDDASSLGGPFYVTDYLDSSSSAPLDTLSPENTTETYKSMCQAMASLHNISPSDCSLSFLATEGLAARIERWTREYRGSETHHIPAMEYLIEWLPRNLPAGDSQPRLVHGDFRLPSLHVSGGDGETPTSVSLPAWRHIALGSALLDVADNCLPFRIDHSQPLLNGVCGLDGPARGVPTEAEYIAWYCHHRGYHNDTIPEWDSYVTIALFGRAVELQKSFHSALADPKESCKDGFASGPVAEYLALLAMELALGPSDTD